ncbi:MAG: translational GTPase TypA [Gemmatimonadetes bacterium]|nr:translational GTPase TypA [Gemmatimonadota bacterium]
MQLRNIAIIAHVDHGKTTLVDQMFRQAGVFRVGQEVVERVLDSNPLERERGITILAKNTSVEWGHTKINIVDTPGHADFGGEVERILRMVDGVLLLVDAAEGPMPQTRFVTRKALALGLTPVIVINKVDRSDARPDEVHDEVLELLMDLEASDEQLDAPFLYGVGREGWVTGEPGARGEDLTPLFEAVVEHIPSPPVDPEGPFQMLVSTLDHSSYVGRIAIGRVERGAVRVGQRVLRLATTTATADPQEAARVVGLYTFNGLDRVDIDEARAGDIIGLAGTDGVEIGDTLTDPRHPERLSGITVEEPTISVDFVVNDSPFSGRSGKYVTTRQLRDRLRRELERNVALRVEATDRPDTFAVSGRGELHLTILMETMRREGYEFQVSRPRVITRRNGDGTRLEPFEEVVAEVPSGLSGTVIDKLARRRGELVSMRPVGDSGTTRLAFSVPARGLFGYRTEFLTDTRGEGILHHRFDRWDAWAGEIRGRGRGAMVADRPGKAVSFAIFGLQERGTMFVEPGLECYGGMIVGKCARPGDMDVNIGRTKKLTNMRAAAADENVRLEPPLRMTLEQALDFIDDDELIEITPDAIRLRKRELDASRRRKAARKRRL